jgi:hypothetical protein
VIALSTSADFGRQSLDLAVTWLAKTQRADGGWPPHSGVDMSTWVTALALLLPQTVMDRLNWRSGVDWLVSNTGRESGWLPRLRAILISGKIEDRRPDGWSFYPSTAAWVTPTAFSILALRKLSVRLGHPPEIRRRITNGQNFLLERRCGDGGWNHGSSRALGYDSQSYPETTGLALLSLKGVSTPEVDGSIAMAEKHLQTCRSLEATRWLELGLIAHGRKVAVKTLEAGHQRTTQELAIDIIATSAALGQHPIIGVDQ